MYRCVYIHAHPCMSMHVWWCIFRLFVRGEIPSGLLALEKEGRKSVKLEREFFFIFVSYQAGCSPYSVSLPFGFFSGVSTPHLITTIVHVQLSSL